jgi:DNA invertase Pin-like site-specific DNA recombinase
MKGQVVGYIRVSTVAQSTARQLDGEILDRVFEDKLSGKNVDREQLRRMLEFVREGDVVKIHSMDRLARNVDDLRRIVKGLTLKGIQVHFIKEGLIFTGEDSPVSNLLLSILGAVAEFERELIRERQMEGIAIAKRNGLYKGRQPLAINKRQIIKNRVAAGDSRTTIAKDLKICRQTLAKYLKE